MFVQLVDKYPIGEPKSLKEEAAIHFLHYLQAGEVYHTAERIIHFNLGMGNESVLTIGEIVDILPLCFSHCDPSVIMTTYRNRPKQKP